MLVVWLFVETRRLVERDKEANGRALNKFVGQRRTYAIVTTFFALSYLGRCFINEVSCLSGDFIFTFVNYVIDMLVYALEGLSMGVLMWYHHLNLNRKEAPKESEYMSRD